MSGSLMKYSSIFGYERAKREDRKAGQKEEAQVAAAAAAAATATKNETESMTAYEAGKKRLLAKTPVPSTGAGTSLLKG